MYKSTRPGKKEKGVLIECVHVFDERELNPIVGLQIPYELKMFVKFVEYAQRMARHEN